jgi:hypothetical protein
MPIRAQRMAQWAIRGNQLSLSGLARHEALAFRAGRSSGRNLHPKPATRDSLLIVRGAVAPVQNAGRVRPVGHGPNRFHLLGDEGVGAPCLRPRPKNVQRLMENIPNLRFVDRKRAKRSIGLDLQDVEID